MYHLGIDLGGTNIAVGVVDENLKIVGRSKIKTNNPRPFEEICDDMALAAKKAVENAGLEFDQIDSIGVGAPGSVNPFTGMIITSNNIKINNAPIVKMLSERLYGREVFVENDASAAAYGEFLAGAGRGTKNMVAITLGTGVGGGIIIDGKLFSGANLYGGEPGHTVIVHDGEQCSCGRKGCWEAYASATALIRQTKEKMKAFPDSKMWEICNGNIDNANGRTAYDGMRAGDKAATEVVDKYHEYVACGIINVVNIFQPEVLCIGGGISKEGETLRKPIADLCAEFNYARIAKQQTKIKVAELGNDAGIIGAASIYKLYRK